MIRALLLATTLLGAQTPPTAAEVQRSMGRPCAGDLRGQKDTVGFATRADQMAALWKAGLTPLSTEGLEDVSLPAPGVAGLICPHDDHLFSGRVLRRVLPLVTARTVVLVGVFHAYRSFGVRGRLVFDRHRAWSAPDGPVPVSSLREALVAALPEGDRLVDDACHDREHSLEALVGWLRHHRPDVEILPILAPAGDFPRIQDLAEHTGRALAGLMRERGLRLGRDVSVVISSDAIHYGADFGHTPFGEGGVEAYQKAVARDLDLLRGPLSGPVTPGKVRAFLEACVEPERPDTYRLPWCGRFSVPFGLLLLREMALAMGEAAPSGHPLAYATTVGQPELPLRGVGLGTTAPSNLYHFVGLPAVAFR